MRYALHSAVAASELADRIGARLNGPDVSIDSVAAANAMETGALTYWQSDAPMLDVLPDDCCALARDRALCRGSEQRVCVLENPNPRLSFIRLLRWFEQEKLLFSASQGEIHPSARIHPTATVDSGALVGAGCEIGPSVYVSSCCNVGSNVTIGAGAVVGHAGFGYERDENGVPVRFPHFGRVVIEDGCDIGCNTTISRGNLSDTVIRSNVKIDDHVYIAHNCEIGESTMIAAGARICGGVVIGSQGWIGAGAMIRQGIEVGNQAVVGLGAVVVRSVDAETVVAGNPAKVLTKR